MRALDRDDEVVDTILYHHERPDGQGYYGKDGEEIPRTARILAVAEVYDAMTNCRVRERVPSERALEHAASQPATRVSTPIASMP